MKLSRKFATIFMVAVMSLSFTACNQKENGKDVVTAAGQSAGENADANSDDLPVVAKIGDIAINKSDLDNAMAQTDYYFQMYYGADFKNNAEIVPTYNTMLDQTLTQLINEEILVMKAKEHKDIKVTEEDINKQIDATKASFASEEEFNTALQTANVTLEQLKADIEKSLYYQKFVETYKNAVTVTDEEINTYYNENIAQYTKKPGANIYHILVDSEEKAKEVLNKYNEGSSFEDLAAEYGTDGTKSTGGSLGFIEYDTTQYDADFMAGAKTLGEGEVSQPVKTQFGWHIIKVDGVQKEEVVQPVAEVSATIKDTLTNQKIDTAISADVEKWRADYKIETFVENYQLAVPTTPNASASSDAATN